MSTFFEAEENCTDTFFVLWLSHNANCCVPFTEGLASPKRRRDGLTALVRDLWPYPGFNGTPVHVQRRDA